MKQFSILTILIISLLMASCKGKTGANKTLATNKSDQIEVIDFYGKHRCISCKAIEANAKYTVETYFADQPKVVFKTVNVDDDKNYAIAERFEATGTALFLNVIKDGKETHIDLTDFGFAKGKDKTIFTTTLKSKIETELKKL